MMSYMGKNKDKKSRILSPTIIFALWLVICVVLAPLSAGIATQRAQFNQTAAYQTMVSLSSAFGSNSWKPFSSAASEYYFEPGQKKIAAPTVGVKKNGSAKVQTVNVTAVLADNTQITLGNTEASASEFQHFGLYYQVNKSLPLSRGKLSVYFNGNQFFAGQVIKLKLCATDTESVQGICKDIDIGDRPDAFAPVFDSVEDQTIANNQGSVVNAGRLISHYEGVAVNRVQVNIMHNGEEYNLTQPGQPGKNGFEYSYDNGQVRLHLVNPTDSTLGNYQVVTSARNAQNLFGNVKFKLTVKHAIGAPDFTNPSNPSFTNGAAVTTAENVVTATASSGIDSNTLRITRDEKGEQTVSGITLHYDTSNHKITYTYNGTSVYVVGEHQWYIWAGANSGEIGKTLITFTVQHAIGAPEFTNPSNPSFTNGTAVITAENVVTATASSGIDSNTLRITRDEKGEQTVSGITLHYDTSNHKITYTYNGTSVYVVGEHQWYIWASANSGEIGKTPITFTVQHAIGAPEFTNPSNPSFTNGTAVITAENVVTATASSGIDSNTLRITRDEKGEQTVSGITLHYDTSNHKITYTYNGTSVYVVGEHQWYIWASANSGESGEAPITFTVKHISGEVSLSCPSIGELNGSLPSGVFNGRQSINIHTVNTAGGTASWSGELHLSSDSSVSYEITKEKTLLKSAYNMGNNDRVCDYFIYPIQVGQSPAGGIDLYIKTSSAPSSAVWYNTDTHDSGGMCLLGKGGSKDQNKWCQLNWQV